MSDEREIGKIEKVELRSIWNKEATDFTSWLKDNIEVINNVTDIELSNVESEQPAGDLKVDLVAEDINGNTVIIENQLEKSDHKHLGQLITYLATMEAKAAIWIVTDPRQEHINAVSWLNESQNADFYLIKLQAIKIDNSLPAPLLTLIVSPSSDVREATGNRSDTVKERVKLTSKFWTLLIEKSKKKGSRFGNSTVTPHNTIYAATDNKNLCYQYSVTQQNLRIELQIKGTDKKESLEILEKLERDKEKIEEKFGDSIDWKKEAKQSDKVCYVRKKLEKGGYRNDEEEWDDIMNDAIDQMIKFEEALKPSIDKLQL